MPGDPDSGTAGRRRRRALIVAASVLVAVLAVATALGVPVLFPSGTGDSGAEAVVAPPGGVASTADPDGAAAGPGPTGRSGPDATGGTGGRPGGGGPTGAVPATAAPGVPGAPGQLPGSPARPPNSSPPAGGSTTTTPPSGDGSAGDGGGPQSPDPPQGGGGGGPSQGTLFTALGGTVRVKCSNDVARVTDMDVAAGYSVKDYDPGPAGEIQVVLLSSTNESEIKVACYDGVPVPRIKESPQ